MTTPAPEPDEQPVDKIVIIYDPPGQEPQQWEFDPTRWTVGEIKLIEQEFGKPRDAFFEDVAAGFDTAKVFVLWLIRCRTEPKLRLGELDSMLSPYLDLIALIKDDAAEDDDPQPDPVNDPKGGRSGPSVATPESQLRPVGSQIG